MFSLLDLEASPVLHLLPTPDEGLTPEDEALRLFDTPWLANNPSQRPDVMWYIRPNSREDEMTAFICQRSGYKFPGRYRRIDGDGKSVGEPFYREDD